MNLLHIDAPNIRLRAVFYYKGRMLLKGAMQSQSRLWMSPISPYTSSKSMWFRQQKWWKRTSLH